jgi:DNA polymerase III subunit alpha
MSNKFTHLHLHTEYSLRDAITSPESLMKKCAESSMSHVAVTDHGNLMGIHKSKVYADKYGVNLIPGNEMYLVPDVEKCRGKGWMRGKSSHLVLLAKDNTGWENLKLLTTKSNKLGYYSEPRIDYAMLREHSKGIVALTACLGGVLAKPWFKKSPMALVADQMLDIFGKDNFFLEIQLNSQEVQKEYNQALIELAETSGANLVATVDSHYLNRSDSHKQDLVFCLGMNKELDDPDRHRYPPEQHSVETPEEVYAKFENQYGSIGRSAVAMTQQIADNCKVDFETETRNYKIPSVSISEKSDYDEFIKWKHSVLQKG